MHLSKIASHMMTRAQKESNVVRLSRFLGNESVDVESWYGAYAEATVDRLVKAGAEIRLIVDGSKVGFGHQLLMIAIAYRRRSIPLVWTWTEHKRGHSCVAVQKALLEKADALIPEGANVSLLGDSEFGNPKLLQKLESWGWCYALRQSGRELYQDKDGVWKRLSKAVTAGQSQDLGACLLTKAHQHKTHLIAHWHKSEKDPWLLATNFPDKKTCLKAYMLRMWIEEMFADFKGNGFDLESSRLRAADKLNRLTLAVCLLYLWLVAFGSKVIKLGQRKLVDRKSRRDLSLFRIGLDMIHRFIANHSSYSLFLTPYP
ncbi:MAG: IS4 family transposase [Deinococcota bacterium]